MKTPNIPNKCYQLADESHLVKSADYEVMNRIVLDSNTWQDLGQIARLSGLPEGRCKKLLQLLIVNGAIGFKHLASHKSSENQIVYIKTSAYEAEVSDQEKISEFKYAKSRFCTRTGLISKGYTSKQNSNQSLALLSRRVN